MIFFSTDQRRLQDPQPSDIRPGLSVAPFPDPGITKGCEPFATLKIGEEETEVVFVGVEAGLIVKSDFKEWKAEMMTWLTQNYKENGANFANLKGHLIEWAIGMLWPDQSYVSLRRYRVHQTGGWCEFHAARFKMFVGEY